MIRYKHTALVFGQLVFACVSIVNGGVHSTVRRPENLSHLTVWLVRSIPKDRTNSARSSESWCSCIDHQGIASAKRIACHGDRILTVSSKPLTSFTHIAFKENTKYSMLSVSTSLFRSLTDKFQWYARYEKFPEAWLRKTGRIPGLLIVFLRNGGD